VEQAVGTATNAIPKVNAVARRPKQPAPVYDDDEDDEDEQFVIPSTGGGKRRIVPVKVSRITDRPVVQNPKESAVRIKIELDLEVEVEIYARVKGDVTIGLL